MAYTVSISGSLLQITEADGSTQTINGSNIVDDGLVVSQVFRQGTTGTGDPTMQATITRSANFRITVHLVDQREYNFYVSDVTNQASWTNDLAGANKAVLDISAAMVSAGGGGGAPSGAAGGDLSGSTYPNPVIGVNKVTNAQMAQAAAGTLRGNLTGSTANVSDNSIATTQAALQTGIFYRAILSQTGTSAPTLSGSTTNSATNLVPAYASVGVYSLTASGVFTGNKTRCFLQKGTGSATGEVWISRTNTNVVQINTVNAAGTATDGIINNGSLYIIVDL